LILLNRSLYGFEILILAVYPSDLASGIIGDGVFPKNKIPLERVGTEEDMAGAILFLTSRAGAYVTGNVLLTDGGRLSNLPSSY
jgi:NAD(P)-dependent dehydrogenase (short-subunit alcohol dehydrogenase family)